MKIFSLAILWHFTFLLPGNEFWLYPGKFIFKEGETIHISFLQGNDFSGKGWAGNKKNIEKMFFYWAETKDSCNQHVTGDLFSIAVLDAGTAMLTFQSKPEYVETPAATFNKHLEAEEQLTAYDTRKNNEQDQAPGREQVHHFAKTIIQVGNNTDKTYKKDTGLPLEIIPNDNPYGLTKDGDFKVSIRFNDQPLVHAPVKILHKVGQKISLHRLKTDDDGEVNFFISATGEWMVSALVMKPAINNKADWETYKGTLTWGYTR